MSTNSSGLVSIITPTWECGEFIGDTIRSIQTQTYQDWELLIQDDCSTDNTEEIVDGYASNDSRIKYVKNPVNSGAAITRNNAIQRAKGKWIAFLDSDDMWLPEKLEHQIGFMVKNGYAFSYHAYSEISENGEDLGIVVRGKKNVSKFDMFACCWPGCLTVMYDRERIGLVQINDVRKNNDTALWLKVVRKFPCRFLDENMALYRRRRVSITPKPLIKRIWAHYPLFRIAEKMNPFGAAFWTIINVFGNGIKKLFYVKKI